MKTLTTKTVLTLTAFMSVNAAFANTLPPTFDCSKRVTSDMIAKNNTVKETKSLTTESYRKKALANSLPPTPEYPALCRQTIKFAPSMQRVNMG